ncbi:uncharacterized protein METZ01_LOCUS311863, partial [marine metagenome]
PDYGSLRTFCNSQWFIFMQFMIWERDESTRHVAKRCAPKRKESKVPERVRIPLRPPFFSKKNGFLGYSLIFLVILNDKIMTSFPAAPCTASMIKNQNHI